MSNQNSYQYVEDAKYLMENNNNLSNAILTIRKAVVANPQSVRAHYQSMFYHFLSNRNDHAVLHGLFAKVDKEYPEKWFYYAIHGMSLYKLSIEHHLLGDSNAYDLLSHAIESFEVAYRDHPEMVRQKFSDFMFLIEGLPTLKKIEVESDGTIPFAMHSANQDFNSHINLDTLVNHLQNKIKKYGTLTPYIIQDLETGAVGRFSACNNITKWEPLGTTYLRMLNLTSNGGILVKGNDDTMLIEHITRVDECFLPYQFKAMYPHNSITFIETKDKNNKIERFAFLDSVTYEEKGYDSVLNNYLYIQRKVNDKNLRT